MAELSPKAVAARLAELRALYVAEDEDGARARLEAGDVRPPESFAEAVARRLQELRALDDLTRYLHKARRAAERPSSG